MSTHSVMVYILRWLRPQMLTYRWTINFLLPVLYIILRI